MTHEACTLLSERIPEVARGRGMWTVDEETHLAGCADCRAEWELARMTRALALRGEGLVEPHAVAETVTRRLHEARPSHPLRRRVRWIGVAVAAAAAILLLVQTVSPPAPTADTPGASAQESALHLPGLDSLTVDELEMVLATIEEPIEAVSTFDASEWTELEDHELERLLREWEG